MIQIIIQYIYVECSTPLLESLPLFSLHALDFSRNIMILILRYNLYLYQIYISKQYPYLLNIKMCNVTFSYLICYERDYSWLMLQIVIIQNKINSQRRAERRRTYWLMSLRFRCSILVWRCCWKVSLLTYLLTYLYLRESHNVHYNLGAYYAPSIIIIDQ